MLLSRAPSPERLGSLLAEQQAEQPTYDGVGSTRAVQFPAGYHHDRYAIRLGNDPSSFERGVVGLRRWVADIGAGVEVVPSDAPIEANTTVVLVLPVGPLRAIAACRIVYVIDEPDRFGFAHGTLPLHPEQGEESFVIERDGDGAVWFRIAAFSRPRKLVARLGSPVSRVVQRRVTNGYLRSMQRWAAQARR